MFCVHVHLGSCLEVKHTFRRKEKISHSSGLCSNAAADELSAIMQRAHTQDPERKFVRDIKTSPGPAIVLADDQQLHDLKRFCI